MMHECLATVLPGGFVDSDASQMSGIITLDGGLLNWSGAAHWVSCLITRVPLAGCDLSSPQHSRKMI